MKKVKLLLAGAFALLIVFKTQAQTKCDKCTTSPQYAANDHEGDFACTDMSVENLTVTDGGTFVKASITILDKGDDSAQGVQLIVTLPVNVKDVSATVGSKSISFQQCGATYKFCVGSLDKDKPLTVSIKTSKCMTAYCKDWESFGAFVYATTPDPCPINNYKAWVNTKAGAVGGCSSYISTMVKTGF